MKWFPDYLKSGYRERETVRKASYANELPTDFTPLKPKAIRARSYKPIIQKYNDIKERRWSK